MVINGRLPKNVVNHVKQLKQQTRTPALLKKTLEHHYSASLLLRDSNLNENIWKIVPVFKFGSGGWQRVDGLDWGAEIVE